MSHKKTMSLQKLSVHLPKLNIPTKQAARLQFPMHGDSSIFEGVGRKHFVYRNDEPLNKADIVDLKNLQEQQIKTRRLTIADASPAPPQIIPVTKPSVSNPEDTLSLMQKHFNSKQLFPSHQVATEPAEQSKKQHQPLKQRPPIALEQVLIGKSQRVNSLPHMSPVDSKPAPINRYNIAEMRKFNPTFLSSAIQVDNKLPLFMF